MISMLTTLYIHAYVIHVILWRNICVHIILYTSVEADICTHRCLYFTDKKSNLITSVLHFK